MSAGGGGGEVYPRMIVPMTWGDYERITEKFHRHMEENGGLQFLETRWLINLAVNLESIAAQVRDEIEAKGRKR